MRLDNFPNAISIHVSQHNETLMLIWVNVWLCQSQSRLKSPLQLSSLDKCFVVLWPRDVKCGLVCMLQLLTPTLYLHL